MDVLFGKTWTLEFQTPTRLEQLRVKNSVFSDTKEMNRVVSKVEKMQARFLRMRETL